MSNGFERALLLSGGGARGATQVPVLEYLKANYIYDLVLGVSIGSNNGVMFAQDQLFELRGIWDQISGTSDFLSTRICFPIHGLYSMNPLREMLEENVKLELLKMPYGAGVVSYNDGEYRNMYSANMTTDKELWDAIEASSCMPGIMVPPLIKIDGKDDIGLDGGVRSIIPVPDHHYKYLDVVACTPLERMNMVAPVEKKATFAETIFRYLTDFLKLVGIDLDRNILSVSLKTIQIMEDEIFDKDILELSKFLKYDADEIRIFYPKFDPGSPLAAARSDILYRYSLGDEAIETPLIIRKSA